MIAWLVSYLFDYRMRFRIWSCRIWLLGTSFWRGLSNRQLPLRRCVRRNKHRGVRIPLRSTSLFFESTLINITVAVTNITIIITINHYYYYYYYYYHHTNNILLIVQSLDYRTALTPLRRTSLFWVFIAGGCIRSGVQWMGVVLYSKTAYNIV